MPEIPEARRMRGDDPIARSLIDATVAAGARLFGPTEKGSPVAPAEMSPPEARGRGLGRRLLGEIEAVARELGYRRLRLDTSGTVRRLYESSGYAAIPDYNGNGRATFWGEKAL